jgi:hypothetical protein
MNSKAELFDELETLGFDCGRNPRYTVSILAEIRDNLRVHVDLLVEQAIELTRKDLLIKTLTQQYIDDSVANYHEKNKYIEELEVKSKLDAQMYLNLEAKHTETEACLRLKCNSIVDAHADLDKALKKHLTYEAYIQQLNKETKELRREFKSHRKKAKNLEKKANGSPPTYEPPEY